jgi:hypothetical protein
MKRKSWIHPKFLQEQEDMTIIHQLGAKEDVESSLFTMTLETSQIAARVQKLRVFDETTFDESKFERTLSDLNRQTFFGRCVFRL